MILKHMRWALLWALVILFICMIPGHKLPSWSWIDLFSIDKLGHAAVFALLAVLSIIGLRKQFSIQLLRTYAVAATFAVAVPYGALLELMQGSELIGRSADPNDMVANTIGCVLGVLFLRSKVGKELVATED